MNPFTTTLQKGIIAALLAALLALGIFAAVKAWQVDDLRHDLQECNNAKAKLSGALDLQNEAVEGWQKAASAAQEVSVKALATARAANAARAPEMKRLADLLAAGKATDCNAAMVEVREGLR